MLSSQSSSSSSVTSFLTDVGSGGVMSFSFITSFSVTSFTSSQSGNQKEHVVTHSDIHYDLDFS